MKKKFDDEDLDLEEERYFFWFIFEFLLFKLEYLRTEKKEEANFVFGCLVHIVNSIFI